AVVAVAGSLHRSLDQDGASELLPAGRDIEGMETLDVGGVPAGHDLGLRNDVKGARLLVDHRRLRDPDFRDDVGAADIAVGDRGDSRRRIDEAYLPDRGAIVIGVKRKDAVVLGGDKDKVSRATRWDHDIGEIKGLCVDVAIDVVRKELSEA